MRRRAALQGLAAAVALVLAASACIGSSHAGGRGAYQAAGVEGRVQILRAEVWSPLAEGAVVSAGEEVRTLAGAVLRLEQENGPEVELAPESRVRVLSGGAVEVVSGNVLGVARGGAPVVLESQGVTARGRAGALRLDRSLSMRIGVYSGAAALASLQGGTDVPRLREVVVVGRTLPRSVEPLSISPLDRWDRRFLADALDVDRELRSLARGFDAQYASAAGSASFFGDFVPVRSLSFVEPYVDGARASDVLVGLVVAALIRQEEGESLAGAFSEGMDMRLRGASWGLIAHERGLDLEDLLTLVLRAVAGKLTALPGLGGSGTGSSGGGSGGGGSGGTGGGNGGGGGGGGPSPTPSPTTSPSPPPPPPPDPCDEPEELLNPDCLTGMLPGS